MQNHFLRFESEQEFLEKMTALDLVLPAYTDTDEEGNEISRPERVLLFSHQHNLDVIGIISKGGEWDSEGNVVVEPTVVPGFHVNFMVEGELPNILKPFVVVPANPFRVWA